MQIKRFDPTKITADKCCIFVGKRGSGKSRLLADILFYKRHIPSGVVFSASEGGNKFFSNFLPESYIYDRFDGDVLAKVFNHQKAKKERMGDKCPPIFIILDDVAYDKTVFKDKTLVEVFLNSRHFHVLLMMTLQWVTLLPPVMRANTDYIFLMQDNQWGSCKRLYEQFGGVFSKLGEFRTAMDKLTANYGVMVIDQTARSSNIDECIFHYKAELRPRFKTGSREFWNLHNANYRPAEARSYKPPSNVIEMV